MEANVVWICGNQKQCKEILEQIRDLFADAEIDILEGEFYIPDLTESVLQTPCFAEKKIVIVRNMPHLKSTRQTMLNQTQKILSKVPGSVLVVFAGIEDDVMLKYVAQMGPTGKVFAFDNVVNQESAASWVIKAFEEQGKTISLNDAQLMVDSCGYDSSLSAIGVDVMNIAIEKVCLYLGKRKNVSKDDVLINTFPSQEFVIWHIFEALDRKDFNECQNHFLQLCEHEHDVVSAVNILFNVSLPRYRLFLLLKEALARGASRDQLIKDVSEIPKLSQSGKNWMMRMSTESVETGDNKGNLKPAFTEFSIQSALVGKFGRKPTIDLYSRKEIGRIVKCLQASMIELRARSQSVPAMSLLADSLFWTICNKMDDSLLETLREPYAYAK